MPRNKSAGLGFVGIANMGHGHVGILVCFSGIPHFWKGSHSVIGLSNVQWAQSVNGNVALSPMNVRSHKVVFFLFPYLTSVFFAFFVLCYRATPFLWEFTLRADWQVIELSIFRAFRVLKFESFMNCIMWVKVLINRIKSKYFLNY